MLIIYAPVFFFSFLLWILFFCYQNHEITWLAFTCSKSGTETLEKGVKYVQI